MPLSKIIIEASRDKLGEYLLDSEDDLPREFSLEELEPVFDYCKELNSPNQRNKVTLFKYLQRFGIMDGITKLRGLSNCRSTKTQVNPSSALNRIKHHQSNPSNVPGILDSNLSKRACVFS